MFGRVIDIQKYSVEFSLGLIRIETLAGKFKEISLTQLAPIVFRHSSSKRNETGLMPIDHCLKEIDDEQPTHRLVLQNLRGGVAQSKTADYDIHLAFKFSES